MKTEHFEPKHLKKLNRHLENNLKKYKLSWWKKLKIFFINKKL